MNKKNKIIILILIFSFIFPQIKNRRISSIQNTKIKEARSLNKNGLTKESIEIYYNLFLESPYLKEALNPLKKILKDNNDLDRLNEISSIYLNHFNNSLDAQLEIIDILIWINYPNWEKIIYSTLNKNKIKDKKIKKTLKILLDNNKIYEVKESIKILRSLRQNDYYSYEMGSYYALNFLIEESIQEYLLHLRFNPKKYFVIRNRILAFPDFDQLNNKIQLLLIDDSSDLSKIILSDLKFREKKFYESYEILKKYSKDDNNLVEFSDNLIDNKEYKLAEEVINDIINNSNNKTVIKKTIIILAELFENIVKSQTDALPLSKSVNKNELLDSPFIKINSEKIHLLENAINIYDSLRINLHDIKSTYQLAEIKYKILGDLDGANKLYNEIVNNKNISSDYKSQAMIKIIDILISKGDLNLAKKTLYEFENDIINKELYSVKNIQILFYLNNWEELKTYSQSFLKQNIKNNKYYNDILKISSDILLFEDDKNSLNIYAKSILKKFQNKRMESMQILSSINQSSNIQVSDKVNYDLSRIYIEQGKYNEAINILNSIDSNSAYIESSYLLKAEIYDYILNNKSKAVDFYLYIIDQFPNSIHYEAIRIRLRELTS